MVSSVSNLGLSPGETVSSIKQHRLVNAAHDFESSMLSELLKPLQHDPLFSEDSGDGGSDSGSGNALTDFSSESLGKALSEHGGFGIAKRILDHFANQQAEKSTTSSKNTLPLTGANY